MISSGNGRSIKKLGYAQGAIYESIIRGWQSWWRRPSYSYKDFEGVFLREIMEEEK
jgi:hypothetical protein